MIDVAVEDIFPLSDAPDTRYIPRKRGRKVHLATLYRWASRGIRGVKLEVIRVGGATCTSGEALQRFFNRLTEAEADPDRQAPRTSAARTRAVEQADRELDRLGV